MITLDELIDSAADALAHQNWDVAEMWFRYAVMLVDYEGGYRGRR